MSFKTIDYKMHSGEAVPILEQDYRLLHYHRGLLEQKVEARGVSQKFGDLLLNSNLTGVDSAITVNTLMTLEEIFPFSPPQDIHSIYPAMSLSHDMLAMVMSNASVATDKDREVLEEKRAYFKDMFYLQALLHFYEGETRPKEYFGEIKERFDCFVPMYHDKIVDFGRFQESIELRMPFGRTMKENGPVEEGQYRLRFGDVVDIGEGLQHILQVFEDIKEKVDIFPEIIYIEDAQDIGWAIGEYAFDGTELLTQKGMGNFICENPFQIPRTIDPLKALVLYNINYVYNKRAKTPSQTKKIFEETTSFFKDIYVLQAGTLFPENEDNEELSRILNMEFALYYSYFQLQSAIITGIQRRIPSRSVTN